MIKFDDLIAKFPKDNDCYCLNCKTFSEKPKIDSHFTGNYVCRYCYSMRILIKWKIQEKRKEKEIKPNHIYFNYNRFKGKANYYDIEKFYPMYMKERSELLSIMFRKPDLRKRAYCFIFSFLFTIFFLIPLILYLIYGITTLLNY